MFAALAAHGHTYPLIPLATAAVQAGHQVVFATGEPFLPTLRAAGLTAVPAGPTIHEAFAGIEPGPADERVGRVLGDVLPRRLVADLTPLLADHRPDAVIHDVAALGAPLAARMHGVPALGHTFGRMFVNGMSEAMVAYTEFAAELDLDPFPAGQVFDICPPSVQSTDFLAQAGRYRCARWRGARPVRWSSGRLAARSCTSRWARRSRPCRCCAPRSTAWPGCRSTCWSRQAR